MSICDPAPDQRGDAEYKTAMAGEMTQRALRTALARARLNAQERPWPRNRRCRSSSTARRSTSWSSRASSSIHTLREKLAHTGPHIGCETIALRRVHGRSRRHVGQVLHGADRAMPGRRSADDRRIRAGRCAARAAGRLPRAARAAVRLLHAGHDHARLPAAAGKSRPHRGGDPLLDGGQPLPLHRLSEHRQGGAARGERSSAATPA